MLLVAGTAQAGLPMEGLGETNNVPALEVMHAEVMVTPAKPMRKNNFFIGLRSIANVQAAFGGSFSAPDPGAETGTDVSRQYYDGFVGMDSTDNALGATSYFGYDSLSAQENGNWLELHSSQENLFNESDESGSGYGVEIGYGHSFYFAGNMTFGMELIGAFMQVSLEDKDTVSGTALLVTDRYSINNPPYSPVLVNESYEGPFDADGQPVPLLDAEPAERLTTPTTVSAMGSRTIDSSLFLMQIGPSVTYRPFNRLAVRMSGGLDITVCNAEFNYNETIHINGLDATQTIRGETSKTETLFAGYLRFAGELGITESWKAYVGLSWETGNSMDMEADGRTASLDLSDSFSVGTGISYRF
jgi:hypothetical protein